MAGPPIKKGSTDVSVIIRILDSTDGTPEEAVEHDTSGIALWYRRDGAAKTTITPAALASLTTAHTDGGIEHIDDGYYRLDVADAAFASGSDKVVIGGTVTGMVVVGTEIPLVSYDPYDGVRMGMTALPDAAADAAGGLPISDDGGLDMDAILEDIANIGASTGAALNIAPTTDNITETLLTLDVVGTSVSGDYNNLQGNSGGSTIVSIEDDGDDIDYVVGFNIGGTRTATGATIVANVNGNADQMSVQARDFVGGDWETVGVVSGAGSASYTTVEVALFEKHTDTDGTVYIRFATETTTPALLEVDQCVVQAVSKTSILVYPLASVWVDEDNGLSSGTTVGIDAAVNNRADDLDNAQDVADALGYKDIRIANANSIELTDSLEGYDVYGNQASLNLSDEQVGGTEFFDLAITGNGASSGGQIKFSNSTFSGTQTMAPFQAEACEFGGTLTADGAGAYRMFRCKSDVADSGSPTFDFSGTGSTTTMECREWFGGGIWVFDSNVTASIEVVLGGKHDLTMGGGDVEFRGTARELEITLSGGETVNIIGLFGPITIDGNGTGSTINIYGQHGGVTNTATGSPTVNTAEGVDGGEVGTNVAALLTRLGTPSDFGSGTSSIAANLEDMADNGTASFDRATDSLQALRDHIGDGSNLTAAGGDGTHLTEAGGDGDHLTEAGGDGDHLTEAGGDGDHLTGLPEVSADVTKISGSAAAADKLEAHALLTLPVTFSGGTTTTAVLVNVDGAAASSTDDYYNDRVLIFNAGTLNHVAAEITDYDGATKTATISAVPTAVTGSHTARML